MPREQAKDRRVQKTERLLRDALGALIHEKRYDAIVVREILERANVGRSAFYAHFPDKDALLVTGIRQMLDEVRPRPEPASAKGVTEFVWFSRDLFEHVDRVRRTGTAMRNRKGRAVVHHHLRRVLLETIADTARKSRRPGVARVPPDLLAEFVVGTFMLVLSWWVDTGSALSARQVDELFLSLVHPTLRSLTVSA